MPFFLTLRKPMIPYGGMGYGTKCGKWVCGAWLGPYMQIIGVVSFWKASFWTFFPINQGVAQGCTLSPTLLLIYFNGLLSEIEKCPELGAKFSKDKLSGLLYPNDFVGIAETGPALQSLINIVHNYSKCWRFEANVKKCATVSFSKTGKGSGKWVSGEEGLSILDSYCYLGVECSSDGSWDKHIKSLTGGKSF